MTAIAERYRYLASLALRRNSWTDLYDRLSSEKKSRWTDLRRTDSNLRARSALFLWFKNLPRCRRKPPRSTPRFYTLLLDRLFYILYFYFTFLSSLQINYNILTTVDIFVLKLYTFRHNLKINWKRRISKSDNNKRI